MAEGTTPEEGSSAAGTWWGSWYNSAKAKTSTVLEAVKKDLDELSTAVKTEASNVGAAFENTLKFDEEASAVGTVKKSLSSFFGQVTEALIPSIDDDEVEAVLITSDGTLTLTGFQKHLADLQRNEKTYTEEPCDELVEKYKRWLEVVEQDQFTQNRLARHLASSEILNEKYLNLVPEKIPHMEFWKRYLFKRALLEDAIANAEIAEKRAKAELSSVKPVSPRKSIVQTEQPKLACTENEKDVITEKEKINEKPAEEDNEKSLDEELLDESINWEAEDITCNIELSEEEQIRLLEQYEQEIQGRDKRRSLVLPNDINPIEIKKNPITSVSQKKPNPINKQLNDKKLDNKNQQQIKNNKKNQKTTTTSSNKSNAKLIETQTKVSVKSKPKERLDSASSSLADSEGSETNKPLSKSKISAINPKIDNHQSKLTSSSDDDSWEKDFD